jgi:phosphatidylinositol glycan class V
MLQVLTRFICSSSPVIYWFISNLTTPTHKLSPVTSHHHSNGTTHTGPQYAAETHHHDNKTHDNTTTTNSVNIHNNDTTMGSSETTNKHEPVSDCGDDSINRVTLLPNGTLVHTASEEVFRDLDDLYDWDSNNWLHKIIFIYIHLYFFVGIAAFVNFLPWT